MDTLKIASDFAKSKKRRLETFYEIHVTKKRKSAKKGPLLLAVWAPPGNKKPKRFVEKTTFDDAGPRNH